MCLVSRRLMRDDAAIAAPGLFGEPMQMVHRHVHFVDALRQRLAVFQGNGAGDFIPAALQFAGNFVQIPAARLARQPPPAGESGMSVLNRLGQAGPVNGRHLGKDPARGRIPDREPFCRRDKFAIQVKRISFHNVWKMLKI